MEQLDIHVGEKWPPNSYLKAYTKIILRWIIYLNIESKIIELPEEIIEKYLCNIGIGKDFLRKRQKVLTKKEKER